MALEMKATCERCGRATDVTDDAYICSYECTFCGGCAESLDRTCPNCGGELRPRPKRTTSTSA